MSRAQVGERFKGKSVAIVGGGPGSLENPRGLVDSHDLVVRVNNYHLLGGTGSRCDVFYSFFGTSIRKKPSELQRDGVTLCMCKCPDAMPIESPWHMRRGMQNGIDFRIIYQWRVSWWFCDTYIPEVSDFLATFQMLDRHVPTTGFSAILDVLSFEPRSVLLTGFDFFTSGRHELLKRWKPKNRDDPIRHMPQLEAQWLRDNLSQYPVRCDAKLKHTLSEHRTVVHAVRLPRQAVPDISKNGERSPVRYPRRAALLRRRRP